MVDLHVLGHVNLVLYLHGFSLLCRMWLAIEKVDFILVKARLTSLVTLAKPLDLARPRSLLWVEASSTWQYAWNQWKLLGTLAKLLAKQE